jgi:hypothetical protein
MTLKRRTRTMALDTETTTTRSTPTEDEGPRFPHVQAQLTGQNGNVFNVIGIVTRAMKKAGVDPKEVDIFRQRAFESGSYDEVLVLAMNTVEVS